MTKECTQFLDSGKTILHFAYSRHCIIDNKVQIMGCTMYVKCERLLFMNNLGINYSEPRHMRHSLCLRRLITLLCTDQTVMSAAIWLLYTLRPSYFFAFVFILLLRDFNVWCTVWHVSGASRPLSFVNKQTNLKNPRMFPWLEFLLGGGRPLSSLAISAYDNDYIHKLMMQQIWLLVVIKMTTS